METTHTTTTTAGSHYMTREFLESQLVQNKAYLAQLESAHANAIARYKDEGAERNRMRNEMQEWTFEAIEAGTLNEDEGQEIANICGFELTKEFELEVTVMYSVTVKAKNEEEAQNAIHDIDFDSVSYGEPVEYLSSSVDRIDI